MTKKKTISLVISRFNTLINNFKSYIFFLIHLKAILLLIKDFIFYFFIAIHLREKKTHQTSFIHHIHTSVGRLNLYILQNPPAPLRLHSLSCYFVTLYSWRISIYLSIQFPKIQRPIVPSVPARPSTTLWIPSQPYLTNCTTCRYHPSCLHPLIPPSKITVFLYPLKNAHFTK